MSVRQSKFRSNLSDEERAERNSPDYIHICSKCNLPKPNTEYNTNRCGYGRKFTSECKSCRALYSKTEGKEMKNRVAIKQRKKHRLNMIFNSAKGNSKRKGIKFDLSQDFINSLFEKQKGLCFYSGKPMYDDITGMENSNDSVSIDKIIPSKGYIEGNVVLCRWIINRIKQDLTIEEFLQMSEDIKNNMKNDV